MEEGYWLDRIPEPHRSAIKNDMARYVITKEEETHKQFIESVRYQPRLDQVKVSVNISIQLTPRYEYWISFQDESNNKSRIFHGVNDRSFGDLAIKEGSCIDTSHDWIINFFEQSTGVRFLHVYIAPKRAPGIELVTIVGQRLDLSRLESTWSRVVWKIPFDSTNDSSRLVEKVSRLENDSSRVEWFFSTRLDSDGQFTHVGAILTNCGIGGWSNWRMVDGRIGEWCNSPIGLVGAISPIGVVGAISPIGVVGAISPIGVVGAISPIGVVGAISPIGVVGAISPIGVVGAISPIGAIGAPMTKYTNHTNWRIPPSTIRQFHHPPIQQIPPMVKIAPTAPITPIYHYWRNWCDWCTITMSTNHHPITIQYSPSKPTP
ncbi:unnamed protein product [Caenorhabditis angaria]|uniref:Uncharacterized protein n=1 Tax=Caenorhabditis angaria TaxID=860376 RepID=A0A9P1I6K0_9PELO|nr:unnamed protein product [Caenorhabditis angaria]